MKEQLEIRALLCEVAYVNGSEGVGCHGNIIPARGCSMSMQLSYLFLQL